jgi:hypothetical protein
MLIIDMGWFGFGAGLTVTVMNLSLVFYCKSLERTISKLAKAISLNCKITMEMKEHGICTHNTQPN